MPTVLTSAASYNPATRRRLADARRPGPHPGRSHSCRAGCLDPRVRTPSAMTRTWHTLLDKALTQGRFRLFPAGGEQPRDRQVLHYKVLSACSTTATNHRRRSIPAGLERLVDRSTRQLMLDARSNNWRARPIRGPEPVGRDPQRPPGLERIFECWPAPGPWARADPGNRRRASARASPAERRYRRRRSLGYSWACTLWRSFQHDRQPGAPGPAYLKIDGSYIRAIDQEATSASLSKHPAGRPQHDLPLIAARVDNRGELRVIREMGVEGVQGSWSVNRELEVMP